jgi:hypothetical protein
MLSFRAKRRIPLLLSDPQELPSHHTPIQSYGPLNLLLARLLLLQNLAVLPFQGQPRNLETGSLEASCYVHQQANQALIKIYVRLVILPNLFSCQISSSSTSVDYPLQQVWVLLNPESCKLQIASNPMFGARQLSLNRDTEPVVALTPNIRLNLASRMATSAVATDRRDRFRDRSSPAAPGACERAP